MTRAIEILTSEHRVIELVLASLETFVEKVGSGIEDERVTLRDYLTFLKGFADQCHHGKEEDILFATMASRGFPEETGPLAVLHLEHIMGRGYIGALASIAEGSKPLTREEREILRTHALAYIGLLRAHIQKEGKEFYPVFLGAHASSVLQMSRSTGRSIFSHVRRARRKEIWQMTNDQ